MPNKLKYALIDRDGTIIVERNYLSDPAAVELLPGAAAGLRLLSEAGWKLIVVSNQAGVGRGYFTEADVGRVNARMVELLAAEGVGLDGIYYCPHAPSDNCPCRKPLPGMALRAAREHGFDPKDAVVIGDKPCDVELGRAVGAKTVFVRSGHGSEYAEADLGNPDLVAADLGEAAGLLSRGGGRQC